MLWLAKHRRASIDHLGDEDNRIRHIVTVDVHMLGVPLLHVNRAVENHTYTPNTARSRWETRLAASLLLVNRVAEYLPRAVEYPPCG